MWSDLIRRWSDLGGDLIKGERMWKADQTEQTELTVLSDWTEISELTELIDLSELT